VKSCQEASKMAPRLVADKAKYMALALRIPKLEASPA
jgi:hypothetical protein